MGKRRQIVFGLVLALMALLGGQIVFGTPVFGATAPTISISLSTLSPLDVTPGHFDSVSQTISVTTNNYTGYTSTLTNPTNSTDLVHTSDNTLVIPTITLPSGTTSIVSSDFTSGYGISTDNTHFVPAPTSPNNIQIGSNNTSGTGSHILTFGVKPDTSTNAGTYIKTFVVTAIVNNPQYSVTYDANAGTDTVTNMPNNQSAIISSTGTFTLPDTVPSRTSYIFLGWDTNSTATTPTYPTGNTNVIDLEPTQANSISLYAIWEYEPEPVIADYTEEFSTATGSTASVTTSLTTGNHGMTPSEYVTKIFAYTNNTGRTISSISVEIVYSKQNQGSTSGYLVGKLNINGTEYTASPVSVPRGKVTNQHLALAQFNNLNIPSSSNVSFTIGTESDSFSAGITISSQTVTVTFAD